MGYDWLEQSSLGFYRIWVVHLGRRYGILQALAESGTPLTANQLAERTRLHLPGVKLWCEAARALGLIIGRAHGYCLPRHMKKLLVDESHTDYLAGQFSYLALRSLDYDAFDGFLKRGIRAQDSPHLVEAFREATRWDHTLFLEVLLPRSPSVRSIFLKKSKILDVGSGTGGWIFRMGESFPLPHYTGIESDAVAIEMATKRARQGGPSSVRFMKGNVEKMTIPREFDLVYLGEVLCVTHRRPQIVRRCFEALKPNGYLVVGEGLLDERSSGEPIGGLMRGMQLDFALLGAGFLSRIQLTDLLRGAGFRGLRFVSAGGGFWFVVARRRRAGCELVASDVLPSKEET